MWLGKLAHWTPFHLQEKFCHHIPTFTVKHWYRFVWDFQMMKSNTQCKYAESTSVLLTADCQALRTEACYCLLQPELPVTGNIAGAWTVQSTYQAPTKWCDYRQAQGATQPSSTEHQNTSPSSLGIAMHETIPLPPFIFKALCRLEHRVNLSCGLK